MRGTSKWSRVSASLRTGCRLGCGTSFRTCLVSALSVCLTPVHPPHPCLLGLPSPCTAFFLVLIIFVAFDVKPLFGPGLHRREAVVSLLLLYGTSSSGFTYLASFLFRNASSGQNTILMINVFCVLREEGGGRGRVVACLGLHVSSS